ncbi:MAG: hypothetical protein FAZ92_00136 [Accumulibacter sp.]|nr:MAG: hypothetical protein FAZ92_00136 [Accumulibacter sp.]
MDRRPFRVQVAQRFGFADRRRGVNVGDPALVDRRAAQEARLVVIVVGDHLEHQRAHLVAVADEREEQPVGIVEAGAVELAVPQIDELLHLRGAKIAARDGLRHLPVARPDARGVQARVFENLHDCFRRGGWESCAVSPTRPNRAGPANDDRWTIGGPGRRQGSPL